MKKEKYTLNKHIKKYKYSNMEHKFFLINIPHLSIIKLR